MHEEDFKRSTVAGVRCLQRGDRQMPIAMRRVFAFAFPIADSPLEIWKHLAVKLAFNEWVESQDWSKGEEPSPVQVALRQLRNA